MTSKNVVVKDEVYKKLLKVKKSDASFSDLIERLLEGRSNLMAFAGVLSDKEANLFQKDIRELRKKTVLRY